MKELKILFCNIGYMKFYNGSYENDTIVNGGEYVDSHNAGGEVINFDYKRDPNYIFGFVETKHHYGYNDKGYSIPNQLRIENIDRSSLKKDLVNDVLVVFCAKSPINNGTVVVGWYEHATAYRYRQKYIGDHGNGFGYNFKVKKENAYLIPENKRTFMAKRARKDGIGFGQSNVWYPFNYDSEEYLDNVLNYLNDIKHSLVKNYI